MLAGALVLVQLLRSVSAAGNGNDGVYTATSMAVAAQFGNEVLVAVVILVPSDFVPNSRPSFLSIRLHYVFFGPSLA